MKSRDIQLSIIIPFLNEEHSLPVLRNRLESLQELPQAHEIVFVSDEKLPVRMSASGTVCWPVCPRRHRKPSQDPNQNVLSRPL